MARDAATQARIDRLQRAFAAIAAEHASAERWNNLSKIEALATAMKLIDACLCIEEGVAAIAEAKADRNSIALDALREIVPADERDVAILRRLREIALDRDIFGERRRAEAAPRAVENEGRGEHGGGKSRAAAKGARVRAYRHHGLRRRGRRLVASAHDIGSRPRVAAS